MKAIKLTSKRQATFPVEVCNDLGVGPGDEIFLEKTEVNGARSWILRTRQPDTGWFASLEQYAQGKSHEMNEVRVSIGKGIGEALE